MTSDAEIEERNRYWFTNWREFSAEIVVSTPRAPGLMNWFTPAGFIDRGRVEIREDGTLWVFGQRQTYTWNLYETFLVLCPDGVEMRAPNEPVIFLRGPVRAPIAGCLAEHYGAPHDQS